MRGVRRDWGVDGALVLPDVGFWGTEGAAPLDAVGFPQPSRVLRVILRGRGLDLAMGVLFFSSDGVIGGASLPTLVWDAGLGTEFVG